MNDQLNRTRAGRLGVAESDYSTELANRIITVHKEGAEGGLIINALSGSIDQPVAERPDWSEGLMTALLMERHQWYQSRFSPSQLPTVCPIMPDAISFEDLGWIGTNAAGEAVELSADIEYRMNKIAEIEGINRDAGAVDAAASGDTSARDSVENEVAHVAIDRPYSETEVTAFDKAKEQGFEQKTGTK